MVSDKMELRSYHTYATDHLRVDNMRHLLSFPIQEQTSLTRVARLQHHFQPN